MDTTIIVEGMHCSSCKALLTMALEKPEHGLQIKEVSIIEGAHQGEIILTDATDADITKAKEIINEFEQYSVKA